jgi:flagellar hook protein FlgE
VKFAADGTPADGASSFDVTVQPQDLPEMPLTIDLGAPGSFAGVTSIASSTTSQISLQKQDGLAVGRLTTTAFDDQGRLTLTYSNGEKRTPATLLLARVATPKQLREIGDSLFTAAAGATISLGTAQSAGNGRIVGGKVEASNVDLTQQFTTLIIIQRGYQASSQLTSVANEMMQQLLSMEQQK